MELLKNNLSSTQNNVYQAAYLDLAINAIASKDLVVIDSTVSDYKSLIAGVKPGTQVAVIDAAQDGLEQITAILRQYPQTERLVIMAHGEPGAIYLGNGRITTETLQTHRALLQSWAVKEIMLCSCRVGADAAFIAELERFTGSRVIASTEILSAGNWLPQMAAIFEPETLAQYSGKFPLSRDTDNSQQLPNSASAAKINGNFLYMPQGDRIDIYSISSTGKLGTLSSYVTYDPSFPNSFVDIDFLTIGDKTKAYVKDAYSRIAVMEVYSDGSLSWDENFTSPPSTSEESFWAEGITINGNFLYSTNTGNNSIDIYTINLDGSLQPQTSFIGNEANRFNSPVDIDFFIAGSQTKAYVADRSGRIALMNVDSQGNLTWDSEFTTFDPDNYTYLTGIEINGNVLYATDFFGDQIDIFNIHPTTGALTATDSFDLKSTKEVFNDSIPLDMDFFTIPNGPTKAYVPIDSNPYYEGSSSIVTLNVLQTPEVSSITSTTDNGAYKVGSPINITVNFSEAVTLAGGSLILTLDNGGTVTIDTITNSTSATGTYTVGAGQNSADLSVTNLSLAAEATLVNSTNSNVVLTVPTGQGLQDNKAIVVDTITPAIKGVTLPAEKIYAAGQDLYFIVNFSESVTVNQANGTPTIGVALDNNAVEATYVSGTGTSELVFRYTTVAGDLDINGIRVNNRISLNGGTIQDTATNNAASSLTGLVGSTAGIIVDGVAPAVTSVTLPTDKIYIAGQNLDFTVNFDDKVVVNTTTGTPTIAVTIGDKVVNALYTSGDGSNALVFRYTTVAGDLDSDGIGVANEITLNGGTIADAVTNNAASTLTGIGSTAGITVDTIAPAIAGVTLPANKTYAAGQDIDFIVNFSENVTVNTTTGTPTIAVALDNSAVDATYVSGSGTNALVFRYTTVAGDFDSNGVRVGNRISLNGSTITDAATNNAASSLARLIDSTANITVDAVIPTITGVNLASNNGIYGQGENIDFAVSFSEAVTINQGSGSSLLSATLDNETVNFALVNSGEFRACFKTIAK